MKVLFFHIGIFLMGGVVCPVPARVVEKVLTQVEGEMITLLDLKEAQKRLRGRFFDSSPLLDLFGKKDLRSHSSTLQKFLRDRLLLIQFGREKELTVPSSQIQMEIKKRQKQRGLSPKAFSRMLVLYGFSPDSYRAFLKNHFIQHQVVQTEIIQKIHISDKALNDYSLKETGKNLFTSHQYDLAYLSYPKTPQNLEILKQMREKLKKDPFLFDQWIQEPETNKGFQTGSFEQIKARTLVPVLQKALASLSVQEISGILSFPEEYRIFKVINREPVISGQNQKLYQKLYRKLFKERHKALLKSWLEKRSQISFVSIQA